MSMSITKDIKSVTDLKKRTNEIFRQIHQTGRPVIITVNGKPDAVLIDAKIFEKKLKALNLRTLLSAAESDIKSGRIRSADEFLEDFK
jgi:prevent-host-death family protein